MSSGGLSHRPIIGFPAGPLARHGLVAVQQRLAVAALFVAQLAQVLVFQVVEPHGRRVEEHVVAARGIVPMEAAGADACRVGAGLLLVVPLPCGA